MYDILRISLLILVRFDKIKNLLKLMINNLCLDTLSVIFYYLEYVDYNNICLVSKYWKKAVYDNTIYGIILKEIRFQNLKSTKKVFYYFIRNKNYKIAKEIFSYRNFDIDIIQDILHLNLADSNIDTINTLLDIRSH
jgi:hypothetical protein